MLHHSLDLSLEDLFTPFQAYSAWLIAVSGGPDSLALLRLCAQFRKAYPQIPPMMRAITVDHALRPDSREEAQQVGIWARALDIPHHIVMWEGEKPTTRLQERAREARYALLGQFAKEHHIPLLLTAHHADDQAETVLFRLIRGTGLLGLKGMESQMRREGLIHARPLLCVPKEELIAYCHAYGQAFFEDPSNHNPRFMRTRLKRMLQQLEGEGMRRQGWLRLAKRAARLQAGISWALERFLDQVDCRETGEGINVKGAVLREIPEEWLLHLCLAKIKALSGRTPRLERAESLVGRLQKALIAQEPFCATLGGVLLRSQGGGEIYFQKEKRLSAAPKDAKPVDMGDRDIKGDPL